MLKNILTVVTGVFLLAILCVRAQTVADIAKQEREKNKDKTKVHSKTITERDLKSSGGKMTEVKSADSTKRSAPEESTEPSKAKSSDLKGYDETYWRNRKTTLKGELAELEKKFKKSDEWLSQNHTRYTLDSMTSRKNERDNLQQAVEDKKKELKNMEDEARRAGAPAGWLRD